MVAPSRSSALLVSLVLLIWSLCVQLLSPLAFWFFITRGDAAMLLGAVAIGGGVLGLFGIPFVAAALVLVLQGKIRRGGVLALIGGLVSAISVVAVAAALFALFSPEARVEAEERESTVDVPAPG